MQTWKAGVAESIKIDVRPSFGSLLVSAKTPRDYLHTGTNRESLPRTSSLGNITA